MIAPPRTQIVLFGACLLLWLPAGLAQGSVQSLPPKRHYYYHGFIKSVYDDANDRTIVALQPYRIDEGVNVYQPRNRVTHIMVGFNFAGRKLTARPAAFEFIIVTFTVAESRYLKGKLELTALADGEVISGTQLQVGHDPVYRRQNQGALQIELRARKVGKGEMLLLVPRCLSKETLDGVLSIARKHDVPIFVAARGKLARQAIRERRPRAVVAVACERDLVTGLHDVAGKVPVLGLTMTLPSGPCKGAEVDLAHFEEWVKAFTG